MLVGERMTRRPITVHQKAPISEALTLMKEARIRRLPVVNKRGKLVGIVTEKDLLYATPSPATSLSIYEIHHLLGKITVKEVMTKEVRTVTDDVPLEEVARIMADNKIGSLPVVRQGELVGIVTETDVFKIFLEMLGAREHGLRLTLRVPERVGLLADLTRIVTDRGGNIVALGTFQGEDPAHRTITLKVQDVHPGDLVGDLQRMDIELEDVREV